MVQSLGLGVLAFGFMVEALGLGCRVYDIGFMVKGF
jgi:hypothetical protein